MANNTPSLPADTPNHLRHSHLSRAPLTYRYATHCYESRFLDVFSGIVASEISRVGDTTSLKALFLGPQGPNRWNSGMYVVPFIPLKTSRNLKVSVALAILALVSPVFGEEPGESARSSSKIRSKLALAASKNVAILEVIYFPEEIETEIAVTASKLEKGYWRKTIVRRFQDSDLRSSILDALLKSRFQQRPDGSPDLRWACIFYDANNVRLLSVYLDRFGKGQIDDAEVVSNGGLLKLLRKRFKNR